MAVFQRSFLLRFNYILTVDLLGGIVGAQYPNAFLWNLEFCKRLPNFVLEKA
jgi:hypothetical protein